MALQTRGLIRGAVIHLANEQPLVADLFGLPSTSDTTLVCTNVRSTTGQRPVWADHTDSIFYFGWAAIRFVEIPPGHEGGRIAPSEAAAATRRAITEESDDDIDEDFLRRVRDA
jgi:hypothetical protein